ncbi:oxidoreductase [Nocardioides jiangxiensis]|uniref:Oxidoreductase n=1 Tax=Nocardioides jiangxiensis TaxID=3064524 RepID=A0ABT9B4G4_9ACTN|nr:oxidoreductase [Nocardioides sp. WY-20]MDO7868487.1 oxidoreductase [Nocardioides sp. WY-20]
MDPLASLASLEGVPSAFASSRDGVDALLRDRGLRKTSPELTGESLLRGAWASAVLEGSSATMDQVRAGEGDEISAAAVRVSAELLSLVPVLKRSPLQAFARIHALAGLGSVPSEELGRPRSAEAAAGLQTLSARLLAPTTAPAMLVAAIVHADLATATPFASHNGIVARAAERLVLVARGVDEKSLLVPEEGHRFFRPEYESNLRAYAQASGVSGVHAWLLYAAEAYAKGAEASPVKAK